MKTVQQYIAERTGSAYIRPYVREIAPNSFSRNCVGFYGNINEYLYLMTQVIQELSTETVHTALNASGAMATNDAYDSSEDMNTLIGHLLAVTILPEGSCKIFWGKEEWVHPEQL